MSSRTHHRGEVTTHGPGFGPAAYPPGTSGPGASRPGERDWSVRTDRRRRKRLRAGPAVIAWTFLAPALILFTYFKFLPMLQGLKMSFYEVRPYLGDRYVGWANYQQMTTDPNFVKAIGQTVLLAVGTTAGSIILGFGLALLVEGPARHLWLVRSAAFLPVVTTMAVVAEVWRIMYYPDAGGVINTILGWVGVGPEPFLASEHTALGSVMLVGIWRGAPYDMMIFLAGLAGVDRNLYEAAAVDGAGTVRRFFRITLPLLTPLIFFNLVLQMINSFKAFTPAFIISGGQGGPADSTLFYTLYLYQEGFANFRMGYASAMAWVLLVIIAAFTAGMFLTSRYWVYYADRDGPA